MAVSVPSTRTAVLTAAVWSLRCVIDARKRSGDDGLEKRLISRGRVWQTGRAEHFSVEGNDHAHLRV